MGKVHTQLTNKQTKQETNKQRNKKQTKKQTNRQKNKQILLNCGFYICILFDYCLSLFLFVLFNDNDNI